MNCLVRAAMHAVIGLLITGDTFPPYLYRTVSRMLDDRAQRAICAKRTRATRIDSCDSCPQRNGEGHGATF